MRRLFTSESVTEGHPDKVADTISDAIVDAMLDDDPGARAAIETLVTIGQVVVAGEAATTARVDVPAIVRRTVARIGYDRPGAGFDADSCGILTAIHAQSPDIAAGVADSHESRAGALGDPDDAQGAGDQGIMFGYACDHTAELMPAPIALAHTMSWRLTECRRLGVLDWARPDGKTQATVEFDGRWRPRRVDSVVVSAHHAPGVTQAAIRDQVARHVIRPALDSTGLLMDNDTVILVNPSGRFERGGPAADTGLTGRKTAVDTYGGWARNGGGALSGKDASKVDRSAAYALRQVAKTVVAAGLARECEIQAGYAIGVAHPVSVHIDTRGTGSVPDSSIADAVARVFDLRPAAIIRRLRLLEPVFTRATNYGHMGHGWATWEDTGLADALGRAVG